MILNTQDTWIKANVEELRWDDVEVQEQVTAQKSQKSEKTVGRGDTGIVRIVPGLSKELDLSSSISILLILLYLEAGLKGN